MHSLLHHRLKKSNEFDPYLHGEVKVCERLEKKMKQSNTITQSVRDASLITSTFISREVSIAVLASVPGVPVFNALNGTSLLFSRATTTMQKLFKIFAIKK